MLNTTRPGRAFVLLLLLLSLGACRNKDAEKNQRRMAVDSAVTAFETQLFSAKIDTIFRKNKFNGVAAVFKNGKLLYQDNDGLQDFKKKIKISDSSVFAIGSLSKQFTAAMVLQLQEAGRLGISDRVSKFLPEFQNKEYENITVRQLLNHSSGLDDNSENLKFKSGTDFNYSNKGYRSLGKIIEKVTGKSYDENAVKLFKMAGMRHTYTSDNFAGGNFSGASTGTTQNPQAVENMPKRLSAPDISVAAGGILSTVSDLDIWNRALFGGKILKAESLKAMTEKSSIRPHYVLGNVGYGYGIMMNLGKPRAFFHTGYVKGSPSLNIFYPETKTSVIILSNIANEALGKEGFFAPHAAIKNDADIVEIATEQVQKTLLK